MLIALSPQYHACHLRDLLEAPAKASLDMCKMVERRMWGSMTPLRQFKGVPNEIIRKAEGKQFVSVRVSHLQYFY